ncbi:hypothetical protein GWI33_004373 [Rhynchophorus ferrugineus]|uniref:Uncharacterized protein n=1 Tax=Rhynchophorus ferrugineus TaxID=354439 RepID=A0A834IYX6_RHYFE|nr:hypothetical protein GWI33_004373 [Rhynchophorus ferrugineus]
MRLEGINVYLLCRPHKRKLRWGGKLQGRRNYKRQADEKTRVPPWQRGVNDLLGNLLRHSAMSAPIGFSLLPVNHARR